MLNEPFQLGNLTVPNRVLLSPLAGVSDVPFRRICQDFGAGLSYIEMLSAAGMPHGGRKLKEMVARHPSEERLGVQITGPDPATVAEGSRILMDRGVVLDTLDLNMGCPVKKVIARGCGSALVRDPEHAAAVLRATIAAVNVPVTCKIRIGFKRGDHTVVPVCAALARAGARMIIIHGRTREDGYSDPVRHDRIREGFEAIDANADGQRVWKVGNGNLFDVAGVQRMVDETGCDAVLISRGALGNPWIFRNILAGREEQPTMAEWREVVLRHLGYHRDFYGEGHYAAIRFRKHLLWYVAGFPGSRPLRPILSTVDSLEEVGGRIAAFADGLDPAIRRYDNSARREAVDGGYDPKADMDREHDRGIEHYSEA
jgi:tRNA-dihydrouridine synthase B